MRKKPVNAMGLGSEREGKAHKVGRAHTQCHFLIFLHSPGGIKQTGYTGHSYTRFQSHQRTGSSNGPGSLAVSPTWHAICTYCREGREPSWLSSEKV